MRVKCLLLSVLLPLFTAPYLFADIASIHAKDLPQETSVLAALDDVRQLEPYCSAWTLKWEYSIPRDEVVARLGKDLGFLELAAEKHPDNVELWLVTGLVARYAYNVDVDGSHDAAIKAFGKAEKLVPADYRVLWFRATLECQTMELKAGADEFLAIESSHDGDHLPAAFWFDYLYCATVANLPAHALRAADHLEKIHAADEGNVAPLVTIARKRLVPYDAKRQYAPKEVWEGENAGADTVFTSTICGVRLRVHGNWEANQLELTNGSCVAYFSTDVYQGTVHRLHPSVMLMVQQPKGNETLDDYAKKFLKKGTFEPYVLEHCPVQKCIAMRGVQQGMYGDDGDGHGRMVVFEREQPEFPEVIFETPRDLPKNDAKGKVSYYHPNETQQRIPGKLYYLVMLDTAASIEVPALKDFEYFFDHLTVE